MTVEDRISRRAGVCGGKACIAGHRVPTRSEMAPDRGAMTTIDKGCTVINIPALAELNPSPWIR